MRIVYGSEDNGNVAVVVVMFVKMILEVFKNQKPNNILI